MEKLIFRGVFLGLVLVSGGLNATELSCDSAVGNANGPTALCSIKVQVDKNSGVARGQWNGQSEESKLNAEDDNLVEFFFGGAEAGIWEKVDEEGVSSWGGVIVPTDSEAACSVKCVEINR